MKIATACSLAIVLTVAPAWADKKLDDAVARAEDQLAKGRTEEAVKTLQKVANTAEGHAALGRLHLKIGNFDEAAASLAKAVEMAADPRAKAEALAALSTMDLMNGSTKAAVEHAQQAAQAQETPASLAALARALARAGNGTAALEAAQRAIKAGDTAAAEHSLGEAYLASNRFEEAAAAFRKALALDPRMQLARVGLASALLGQGKAAEAVTEAKQATDADPRLGEGFAVLGTALMAQNSNAWSDAIAQAQQGAFLNPRNPQVQVAVGKLFEANNNIDQAIASYRRALESDPGSVAARRALIHLQVRKGELDAALQDAQKLAAESPQSADVQLQLGTILLRKSDFAGAVAPLEKAAQQGGSAEAHAMLGTAYQYTRKSPEALAAYKKAVEMAPANVDYRTTYGLLLAIGGQIPAGIAELQKVTTTAGYKDPDGFTNLGWALRSAKRFDESGVAYRKAIELDPKNAQAMIGLGWAQLQGKHMDDAIATFAKAAEADAKMVGCDSNSGIAWAYFFKKDLAKAHEFLAKAQACGRSEAKLKENIARVEKGLAAADDGPDVEAPAPKPRLVEQPADAATCSDQLVRGGNAQIKIRAAQCLGKNPGTTGVNALILGLRDANRDVRIASARALGEIGPGAKAAVRYLNEAFQNAIEIRINPSKEESAEVERNKPFADAIRSALQRIGR